MVRLSAAPATGVLVAAARLRLAAVPGLTVKLVEVPVMDPWVAVMVVDWASVRVIEAVRDTAGEGGRMPGTSAPCC